MLPDGCAVTSKEKSFVTVTAPPIQVTFPLSRGRARMMSRSQNALRILREEHSYGLCALFGQPCSLLSPDSLRSEVHSGRDLGAINLGTKDSFHLAANGRRLTEARP